jgi:hypothetical protein
MAGTLKIGRKMLLSEGSHVIFIILHEKITLSASSTNKTDRYDITEILLKMA